MNDIEAAARRLAEAASDVSFRTFVQTNAPCDAPSSVRAFWRAQSDYASALAHAARGEGEAQGAMPRLLEAVRVLSVKREEDVSALAICAYADEVSDAYSAYLRAAERDAATPPPATKAVRLIRWRSAGLLGGYEYRDKSCEPTPEQKRLWGCEEFDAVPAPTPPPATGEAARCEDHGREGCIDCEPATGEAGTRGEVEKARDRVVEQAVEWARSHSRGTRWEVNLDLRMAVETYLEALPEAREGGRG